MSKYAAVETEALIWKKINASIWFRWMKKKTSSLIKDERRDKAQRAYTHGNPKKAHPTGEFTI